MPLKLSSEILVWDEAASLPFSEQAGRLPTVSREFAAETVPSAEAAAARLNEIRTHGAAEFVVLISPQCNCGADEIDRLAGSLAAAPAAGIGLSGGQADSAWDSYPAQIAALLDPPPGDRPLILRRSTLLAQAPFRAVDCPVWDWLIRATQAGVTVLHPDLAAVGTGGAAAATGNPPLALAPLRPAPERDWLLAHLQQARFDGPALDSVDSTAFRAGLFQWHDYLEESHMLAQSIEGRGENQLGDYWHAIMHRREPDYSNAKYWFRRIGRQPLYPELAHIAGGILQTGGLAATEKWRGRLLAGGAWNAAAFVDLCEACAASGDTLSRGPLSQDPLTQAAQRIQQAEFRLLMRVCSLPLLG